MKESRETNGFRTNPLGTYQDERGRGKLAQARWIVELYFMPWGAAKAAMWGEVSGDGPFNSETALKLIRKALGSAPQTSTASEAPATAGQQTQLGRERELSDQVVDVLRRTEGALYECGCELCEETIQKLCAVLTQHATMRKDKS